MMLRRRQRSREPQERLGARKRTTSSFFLKCVLMSTLVFGVGPAFIREYVLLLGCWSLDHPQTPAAGQHQQQDATGGLSCYLSVASKYEGTPCKLPIASNDGYQATSPGNRIVRHLPHLSARIVSVRLPDACEKPARRLY